MDEEDDLHKALSNLSTKQAATYHSLSHSKPISSEDNLPPVGSCSAKLHTLSWTE